MCALRAPEPRHPTASMALPAVSQWPMWLQQASSLRSSVLVSTRQRIDNGSWIRVLPGMRCNILALLNSYPVRYSSTHAQSASCFELTV